MVWLLNDRRRCIFIIWLSMISVHVQRSTYLSLCTSVDYQYTISDNEYCFNETTTGSDSSTSSGSTSNTSVVAFSPTSSSSSVSTESSITTETPTTCHKIPGCLPIHNNRSCITATQNTGNADWFTSASRCEASGGRLVWLHDTNISEFTSIQLQIIKQSSCNSCSFFWIGLVQSLAKDDIYFWKRPRYETIGQCYDGVSCANCSENANQTECELLGCCYNRGSCKYPGNLTKDIQNQFEFHGNVLPKSDRYRHCVGLQEGMHNEWKLRTIHCTGNNLPSNGYICEYNCGTEWPVPAPRQNISIPTGANTDCDATSSSQSSRRLTSPVSSLSLLYLTVPSTKNTTLKHSAINHATATTSGFHGSSTGTSGKKSSLWTVPFIALLSVCSALLLICLVCIIVICKLKRSLGRRSKLYPGTVPDDDEHTYMDLGDHSLRAPPPVELKSVTGTPEGETKLTDANEKSTGMKPYKDRKRKPAPPLPQSAVPNKPPVYKEGNGQVKEDKSKAKETKRQNSSVKKKPPSYNNSVPLDLSDSDENDLYESYAHSQTTDNSYTNAMIEEALKDTNDNDTLTEATVQEEIQRKVSFERQTSNRLRNAQGSFIVSDDAHHEGLAFTERQISNSGLPDIIVQYNANKEAESPLHLQEMQAYENKAFETIDEDATIMQSYENEAFKATDEDAASVDNDKKAYIFSHNAIAEKAQENSEERNKRYTDEIDNPEPGNTLYDDENIPVTKSENTDIDVLPLYEDAVGNPTPDTPLYDDNFVPVSTDADKDTVDILPIYDCAVECNETDELVNSTTVDLPVYEFAVETSEINQSTGANQTSAVMENSSVYDDGEIKGSEPTNIDDLGLYEDYEISKLPPAPPPPMRHDLEEAFNKSDSAQVDVMILKPDNGNRNNNNKMSFGAAENNTLPPEPPKRNGSNQLDNDSNGTIPLKQGNSEEENSVWGDGFTFNFKDSAPVSNPVIKDKITISNITSEQWHNDTDFQNIETKTPTLLDLSLEPERKFRSGSKVDIFDEPSIANSADAYFLDMNDTPSEIVDASPIIGDEKLISISMTSNEPAEAYHLTAPSVFDNSSFGIISNDNYKKTATHAKERNENNRSIATESNSIGNLLDLSSEQMASNTEQADFIHQSIQQNGKYNPMSDLVQVDSYGNDDEIYDIPPPNFPPPELKLK